jgi:dTDP-4-dehydrorhamnose 3,5-epimerase
MSRSKPLKDLPTVTAEGERLGERIDGVVVRRAVTQTDERGTLCEIFNPAWAVHPAPLVYAYQFTVRPGKIKGWHSHRLHDDRIFISRGEVRVVLYDSRIDSPTHGMINEIFRSGVERDLMVIPAGVYHAHQNVGTEDALFISMPSRAYQHDDPDVYRLPVNNDVIPYRFEPSLGR